MTKALLPRLGIGLLALCSTAAAFAGGDPVEPAADKSQVEQGREVYQQYCQSCHGPEGKGLTEQWRERDALGELPAPPHDATGHTWRHSDAMLYQMISEGWRDPFNKSDRLTMPAFGEVLTREEIEDVLAYLRTLWTEEQRQYQRERSAPDNP